MRFRSRTREIILSGHYFIGRGIILLRCKQPADANVMAGSISGSLTVVATVAPAGTPTYQWYSNTSASNSGGTLITGATSAAYAIPTSLTAGTYYYYCVVSAAGADSLASRVVTVSVNPTSTAEYFSFMYGAETATGIISGKRLSVEASLLTPVSTPQTMIVALYNKSGRLISTVNCENTVSGGMVKFNVDLDIPAGIDSGAYVKVFVWNSLIYVPIRDELTFPAIS